MEKVEKIFTDDEERMSDKYEQYLHEMSDGGKKPLIVSGNGEFVAVLGELSSDKALTVLVACMGGCYQTCSSILEESGLDRKTARAVIEGAFELAMDLCDSEGENKDEIFANSVEKARQALGINNVDKSKMN